MNDELTEYLISELGFNRKPETRTGLHQSTEAFLGAFLSQRTPIQGLAIEAIYDGQNALLISATASGKTEAAMVPIGARLLTDTDASLALYVAPTRALLNDLLKRLSTPLHHLGLEVRVRHGDFPLPAQTDSIRVLLTTPESLDVMLSRKAKLLGRTNYLIIDEVHQLFGGSRGDQLGFLIQRLRRVAQRTLQIIGLSATVGNPDAVAAWLCPHSTPARIITDTHQRPIVASFRWQSDSTIFRRLLREGGHDKVLIFANSRRRCDDICLTIRGCEPYEVYVHFSTLEKEEREFVERGFKTNAYAACVATSTLELGIDIGSIQDVVLADSPTTVTAFLQRVGRGGRRGDGNHVTITPLTRLDLLQSIALLTLAEVGKVETASPGRPYSVVLQQILSLVAGKRRMQIHPAELRDLFSAYPWLDESAIESILDRLVVKDVLQRVSGHQAFEIGPKLEDLLEEHAIYSNIDETSTGMAVLHGGKVVGRLPLRRDQIRHSNVILFAGRYWKITGVRDEGLTVEIVRPVPNPVRPIWGRSQSFALSATVAKGMRDVILQQPTLEHHSLDSGSRQQLQAIYTRAPESLAAVNAIWHEQARNDHLYYTFAGSLENHILQLLFDRSGMDCEPAPSINALALASKQPLRFNDLSAGAESVAEVVYENWNALAKWVAKGTFFHLLPKQLQRDEIVVRIMTPEMLQDIHAFERRPILDVDLRLVA